MRVWQLQEAKAKLSELITKAEFEPQIISRHGIHETIVIGIERYKALLKEEEDVVSFFKNSPLNEVNLNLVRQSSSMREIDL